MRPKAPKRRTEGEQTGGAQSDGNIPVKTFSIYCRWKNEKHKGLTGSQGNLSCLALTLITGCCNFFSLFSLSSALLSFRTQTLLVTLPLTFLPLNLFIAFSCLQPSLSLCNSLVSAPSRARFLGPSCQRCLRSHQTFPSVNQPNSSENRRGKMQDKGTRLR